MKPRRPHGRHTQMISEPTRLRVAQERKEHRMHLRFLYPQPVTFQPMVAVGPSDATDENAALGEIVDIGRGGLAIRTTGQSLAQRSLVKVWVPVAGFPVTVPVLTVVTTVRELAPGTYRVGLRFVM